MRVGVQRLAVDQARAGALEGLGEEVGAHAVGVAGDGDDAQAGRAGGDDRAEVGRRLDEHRIAGARPARGTPWRGPAGRPSRRRRRARAGCRRPGARTTRAAPRGPSTGPRSQAPVRRAARARAAPDEVQRLQVERQVAARQRDGAGRRDREQLLQRRALDAARAERHGLPGEVGGGLRVEGRRDERPAPGPRLEHALGRQRGDRALHGDGRGAMARHQLAHRRQALARRAPVRGEPQVLDDASLCVIVGHEQCR